MSKTFLVYVAVLAMVFPVNFLLLDPVKNIYRNETVKKYTLDFTKNAPPIVFIVFDELPLVSLLNKKGMIDAALYPEFSKFSHHSNWYRNAMTISDETETIISSMMTGQYPYFEYFKKEQGNKKPDIKLPIYKEYNDNLFVSGKRQTIVCLDAHLSSTTVKLMKKWCNDKNVNILFNEGIYLNRGNLGS